MSDSVFPAPIRVLVAEDEAIIRMDLREMLEEEGFEVVGEASDGREAVDIAREHKPDLAILDIKMPGMSGIRAAEIITRERISAVLILTAFSQRDLAADAAQAGAMAYLVKPFQKTDLLPAISRASGRTSPISPSASRRASSSIARRAVSWNKG
jgi:response regulator NasT